MIGGTRTRKELREFADAVTKGAQRVLGRRQIGVNKTYGEASGSLRKSLEFKMGKDTISFGSPLPYAAFVHFGVNGTDKKHGSQYSYGSKQPPIDPILKWLKVKPVRLRDEDGKFIKQTDSKMRGRAFVIARALRRNGMAGIKFFEIAFFEQMPKFIERISEALYLDLTDDLNDMKT